MSVEAAVKSLQDEVTILKSEMHTLTRNQVSRRGETGGKGSQGEQGIPGRDAVLVVKTDTETNTVKVYDNEKVVATIVSIPGQNGRDGVTPAAPKDGAPGRDGRNAPSLAEIVAAVIAEVGSRCSAKAV